ncbi:DUF4955 domain-containing protein [Pelagicoccus sp. SDUM812005]|uniref:DUF4955 domain-containing protein n=1 Tax=Pelagicoccus sp. SDUM812005 TaxID=3041257 RepID=UPI00280FB2CB|nr:DUF4955 domain-containing protein [Pelagicoccus sp. SDUM812005]MDQ8180326.1 DUF4955 domain-containing protein [Pelagicoccus sp. SDUM812005]
MRTLFAFAVICSQCSLLLGASEIEKLEQSLSLPDYSYAGYHRSERPIPHVEGPVFDVVAYGAVPDDEKSDRAAIQAAVDAAQEAGGGVVLFPPGRFELNAIGDVDSLRVSGSKIVFRGAGAEKGGSILSMKEAMPPPPPMKLWMSPYAIEVGDRSEDERIGKILANAEAGERRIQVENASALRVGDWIALRLLENDPDFVRSELSGFDHPETRWTSIWQNGVSIWERHQVESVAGNEVVLTSPIFKPIDSRYDWSVVRLYPLSEIGFESLRFEGSWTEPFDHHRSWLDDGGYSILKLNNVANSWIRDCVFVNLNRVCVIVNSVQVTVADCRLEGNPGHNAINFQRSSFCFMTRTQDLASHWHSLGVSNESIANVFLDCFWNSDTCFESHSSQPRYTLFDSCFGGFMKGRGGGAAFNLPTHMEGLLLWNHLKTNPGLEDFQFEPYGETYWRVLQPTIVGMHGTPISFREGQGVVAAHGAPVDGGALFEYQLARRLGQSAERD